MPTKQSSIYLNFHENFDNSSSKLSQNLQLASKENETINIMGLKTLSPGETEISTFTHNNDLFQITTTKRAYTGFTENTGQFLQNGEVKKITDGEYLTNYSQSKNGKTLLDWSNINLPIAFLSIYSGDKLTKLTFRLDDYIKGTEKNDVIWGYGGNDTLIGAGGNDQLDGGIGDDFLYGNDGNDHLSGGWGRNFIHGGEGEDTAYFYQDKLNYLISRDPITGAVAIYNKNGDYRGLVHNDVEFLVFSNGKKTATNTIPYIGKTTILPVSADRPVHRFYNNKEKGFFYTADPSEKLQIEINSSRFNNAETDWPFGYQGATFSSAHTYTGSYSEISDVFQFYNPLTGHHFYTISNEEIEMIEQQIASQESVLEAAGPVFKAYKEDPTPGFQGKEIAVHRFFNPFLQTHFYTADITEKNNIILTGQWDYEGVAFYGEII